MLCCQPVGQFAKGQYRIHTAGDRAVGWILLGRHTWTNEHDIGVWPQRLFEPAPMAEHGRYHRGQVRDQVGIVFFDEMDNAGTHAGNQRRAAVRFVQQAMVLAADQSRPECCLVRFTNPQLEERLLGLLKGDKGQKRGQPR